MINSKRVNFVMTRHDARREALYLTFEYSFKSDQSPDGILAIASEAREMEFDDFTKKLFNGVCSHIDEIDGYIKQSTINWKFERLSRVSLAVLRLCTYEMLYEDDIDASISINEAVELTKEIDDEKGVKFINGVLGKICKLINESDK